MKEYKIGQYIASYPDYLGGEVCYGKIVDIMESEIYGRRYDVEPDYDKATEACEQFTVEYNDIDTKITIEMNKEYGN